MGYTIKEVKEDKNFPFHVYNNGEFVIELETKEEAESEIKYFINIDKENK